MKISITPGSVTSEDLQSKLETKFPQYPFSKRGHFSILKKTNTVGTKILINKNKLLVFGDFPTQKGTIIFIVLVVLLGFLIPLIVYLLAFHPKMKKFEKEIGGFLIEEYGL